MERGSLYSIWDVINIYDGPGVFLTTLNQVSRETGLLFAAHSCQSEVCNGGFRQFFCNSTGVLAPEAVDGFTAIGQVQLGNLLRQAMALLGSPYIREREARQAALDLLPPGRFEELDDKFFALLGSEAGGFEVATDKYAARIVS
jgi:hypothetical protein